VAQAESKSFWGSLQFVLAEFHFARLVGCLTLPPNSLVPALKPEVSVPACSSLNPAFSSHSPGLAPDWRERGKALGIAALY
jgi:hypothetical protein